MDKFSIFEIIEDDPQTALRKQLVRNVHIIHRVFLHIHFVKLRCHDFLCLLNR
jgi:hypothetical protein